MIRDELDKKSVLAFDVNKDKIMKESSISIIEETKGSPRKGGKDAEYLRWIDRKNSMLLEFSKSIVRNRKQQIKNNNGFNGTSPLKTQRIDIKAAKNFQSERVFIQNIKKGEDVKLFEEFFIIGVDSEEVRNIDKKGCEVFSVPPTKLFQYPNLPQNANWYKLTF